MVVKTQRRVLAFSHYRRPRSPIHTVSLRRVGGKVTGNTPALHLHRSGPATQLETQKRLETCSRVSFRPKSELPPHVPVVVVGLKCQVQAIVGSEITYQMTELHDALIAKFDLP